MPRPLRDRFNLAPGKQKTPVLASVPTATEGADAGTAVMRIYDPIDSWGEWFGLSAKEFGAALDSLPDDVEHIELHLNSPGGEVHEGLAILNQLRQHKASVTVVVDGLAASAASFIAMGADKVLVAPNAELMIHNAWAVAIGDTDDLRKAADDLSRINTNLARIYQGRAGGTVDDWLEAMAVETWYSDEEAVAAGLADAILDQEPETTAEARFNLGVFAHAGRAAAPSPYIPRGAAAAVPPAEPAVTTTQEGFDMPNLTQELRNRLGIAENAQLNETELLAALDEALEERAEPAPAAASAQLPEGVTLIDEQQLADLKAAAEDGRAARAQQTADRRRGIVNAAIKDGKIPPARAEHWLAQLEADEEGALAVLNSLHANTIPVAPLGESAGEGTTAEDAAYAAVFPTSKEA
ncbi:head maturation protease, ClpP-related [Brachybacterium phenoliresistens]|uniref:head maturation protease, ClpP-related n=1 Tax=Brachybacterium phenoliresistens TaxID=396014 RepID=UPI0031D1AAAD